MKNVKKKVNYHQNSYIKPLTLPPNLPIPASKYIDCFMLKIKKILYLQKWTKQISIQMQWWGSNSIISNVSIGNILQFIICCSVHLFMRYCIDMKILKIEFVQSKTNIILGNCDINWTQLKLWNGEKQQLQFNVNDLNNNKIGKVQIQFQIFNRINPFKAQKQSKQLNQSLQKFNLQQNHLLNQNLKSQIRFRQGSKQKNNNMINTYTNTSPKYGQSHDNRYRLQIDKQLLQIQPKIKKINNNDIEIIDGRINSINGIKLPECICLDLQTYKSQHELWKLQQEYNLLFHKEDIPIEKIQSIQLNIIETKVEQIQMGRVLVDFPLPNKKYNHYQFDNKGIIKIEIEEDNYTSKQIVDYVKESEVKISCGKLQGKIMIKKLFVNCKEEKKVELMFNKKKKGFCKLRVEPQMKQENIESNKKEQESVKQKKNRKKIYLWAYLGKFQALNKRHYQNTNLFVKIHHNEEQQKDINFYNNSGQSRTLWGQKIPNFKQIITLQVQDQKDIKLKLMNRQQTIYEVGSTNIIIEQIYHQQLAIYKNQKIIGYLEVSIGLGTMMNFNSFMNLHCNIQSHQETKSNKHHNIAEQQHRKHEKSNQSRLSQSSQHQSHKHQQNQNQHQNQKHQSQKHQEYQEPINRQRQKQIHYILNKHQIRPINKNVLQLHNYLFLEIYNKDYKLILDCDKLQIRQFQQNLHEIMPYIKPGELAQIVSIYLNSFNNQISYEKFRQSYSAYSVFYENMVKQRDNAYEKILQNLEEQGITINDLEYEMRHCKKIWFKLSNLCKDAISIQIIRRCEGENTSNEKLCDSLRKYQVFETTLGQFITTECLQQYIIGEVRQLLQISQIDVNLYPLLEKQQIVLSMWQLINIEQEHKHLKHNKYKFKHQEQQKQQEKNIKRKSQKNDLKIIKSPTFGTLGLKNDQNDHHHLNKRKNNPIIDSNSNLQLNNLSLIQNISPINNNTTKFQNSLIIKFSHLKYPIQEVQIEGNKCQFLQLTQKSHNYYNNQIIMIVNYIQYKFSYQTKIIFINGVTISIQCIHDEWMALVDDDSMQYYGTCKIQ